MIKRIKETIAFTHNKITIYVRIDYKNNKIDIVEPVYKQESKFKKKEFVFIGLGCQYMASWRNILEAIIEATKEAEKRMKDYPSEEEEEAMVELSGCERLRITAR